MTILQDLSQASAQDMAAEIAKLKAENGMLRAGYAKKGVNLKIGAKGGLSAYGLGRFPVTLYRGQWERLLGAKEDILAFIEQNAASLSVKAEA